MMEQGFYKDEKLIFHLKQYLRRSFGVGSKNTELDIREVLMLHGLDNKLFYIIFSLKGNLN